MVGSEPCTRMSAAPSPRISVRSTRGPAMATASRAIGRASCRMSKLGVTRVSASSMGPGGGSEGEAPRIWLIAGPTASGKSALALRLAQAVGGEVINADSMQLYRDLSVLTARPPREETLLAPHHLF